MSRVNDRKGSYVSPTHIDVFVKSLKPRVPDEKLKFLTSWDFSKTNTTNVDKP